MWVTDGDGGAIAPREGYRAIELRPDGALALSVIQKDFALDNPDTCPTGGIADLAMANGHAIEKVEKWYCSSARITFCIPVRLEVMALPIWLFMPTA